MDLFIKIEIILIIFLLNLYHGNYNSRVFIETTDGGIGAIANDDYVQLVFSECMSWDSCGFPREKPPSNIL